MSSLSDSDIQHLGRLARLDLTEEEYARYADQLSKVVHYVDRLNEVATDGVEEHIGVTGLKNVMMADEIDASGFDREKALSAAPLRDGEFIEVRAVLGGEVEGA